jgi:nucleoside-diphosphate-sugar epimerase
LYCFAKEGGVERIIFLSSISAFDGCSSLYGKAKLEIEKDAADVGAGIIRSGLLYGPRPSGGMFGSLQRMASDSSIIPLIGSGRYMHSI